MSTPVAVPILDTMGTIKAHSYDLQNNKGASKQASLNDPGMSQDHVPPVKDIKSERGQWSNQFEFILATMGYAVGLGNIWRFPYLVYKNGGGTFLVPYFIMLIFAGLPLFFLELILGQYSGQGPAKVFGRMSPIFKGLGFAMILASFFLNIYYNVIVAWTLYYMVSGFSSELPWTNCTNHSSYHCVQNTIQNTTNSSYDVGPSEDFFLHQMLGLDKEQHHWTNLGGLKWQMVLCLFFAWLIVCLSLIKGVKSTGKVNNLSMNQIRCVKIMIVFSKIHIFLSLGCLFHGFIPIFGSYHSICVRIDFGRRKRGN